MEDVQISILVPTYNSGKTIARCLNSIVAQTYTKYEVIIIDNSSSDDTQEIINEYGSVNPRIHIISERDEGTYDAMNKGIQKSSGEWIYFLGSDDYLVDQNVLSKFHEFTSMARIKYHFVYGNVRSPLLGEKYNGDFGKYNILESNICHQAIFYNKEVFSFVGLYNLKYKIFADYDLNLRCFFHKKVKTKYIDLIVAYFEKGGLSNTTRDENFLTDFPDKASLVRKFGYKKLSLRKLRPHCRSSFEFLLLSLKKIMHSAE
jgi:glycosyltransferase involved in cell wall biosynthesis